MLYRLLAPLAFVIGCTSAPPPAPAGETKVEHADAIVRLELTTTDRAKAVEQLRAWVGWRVDVEYLSGPSASTSGTLRAVEAEQLTLVFGGEDLVISLDNVGAVTRESEAMHAPSATE